MAEAMKIFLVAGEASGDALGSRLMRAIKKLSQEDVFFYGVGGPLMEAEGLDSLFPMEELSVMGLVEILPHARQLLRRIKQTAQLVEDVAPDVVVTIDSPGFAHQLAGRIASLSCPKIHYVAPSVWAWKPGRVHKCKRHFDHLMALLPFEPPYFEKVGLPCHFVGHSVIESGADKGDGQAFRAKHGIAPDEKLLCVLPGSRRGEVTRLLPVFEKTVEKLYARIGDFRIVVPVTQGVKPVIAEATKTWPGHAILVYGQGEKYDAMAASNAALAASGTVALELAMAKVPTVVAYKFAPVTYFLAKRLVKTPYAHLLNTILGRFAVPERVQDACQPETLSQDILGLLGGEGTRQIDDILPALDQLTPNNHEKPSECAARVVLDVIQGQIENQSQN